MKSKQEQGRLNRINGRAFELRVRIDLESNGYVVDRWTNNVDITNNKLIPARPKMVFNPVLKRMLHQQNNSGFPDFIYFEKGCEEQPVYGVECKINGKLDRTEREKVKWLLKNKIFSKMYVAYKIKDKGKVRIVYRDLELVEDDGKR